MFVALGSSLLFLFGTPSPAPGAQVAQEAMAAAKADADGSSLGGPLIVHGKVISDEMLKRFLCFSVGAQLVDNAKFGIILEDEIGRRVAAGAQASDFSATDAEAEKRFKGEVDAFQLRYPTLDPATEISRSHRSVELYKESMRQMIVFDKLFMPLNPDDWPPLTIELVIEWGGTGFVDDAKESYEARKKYAEEQGLDEIAPDDPIFTEALRQIILEALQKFSDIVSDPVELDALQRARIEAQLAQNPDLSREDFFQKDEGGNETLRSEHALILMVDGVPVPMQGIYEKIEPHLPAQELRDARRFLVLMTLLERDLVERETLLNTADFQKAVLGDRAGEFTYPELLAEHEMMAKHILGFPSMQAYERYLRISESFKVDLAEILEDPEKIEVFLPRINQITGAARTNCEVILISAFDFEKAEWKENGWKWAEKRAKELKTHLEAGADFTQMRELYSEFWDPPMPQTGNTPAHTLLEKGKFGAETRNQLLHKMYESEYQMLLTGQAVTDYMFYDQPVGTVEGPFRGPKGYYLTRVLSRSPSSNPLDMNEPVHRRIATEHITKNHIKKRSKELMDAALESGDVLGLEAN